MYGFSSKVKVATLVAALCLAVGLTVAPSSVAAEPLQTKPRVRQGARPQKKIRRVSAKRGSKARRRLGAVSNVNTAAAGRSTEVTTTATEPSGAPAPVAVEPFSAIAREIKRGESTSLLFKRTELDGRARATAQVVLRGRQLFVRVKARDLPPPSLYGQRHYVLWVDLPDYGQKLFLGDLPVVGVKRRTGRGDSDTAYYSASLPEGATFGGLMLTAEPKRYVPTPNEPLHLILVALPPKAAADARVADAPKPPAGGGSQGQKAEAQKRARP